MDNDSILEMLLNCLRCDASDIDRDALCQLDESAHARMYGLAQRLGVAPLVYHRLREQSAASAIPPTILQAYKESYVGTAARNLQALRELRELTSTLQAAGIVVIALKGAFLTEVVYRNPGVRPMVDLDLLAPPERLQQAAEILAASGYRASRPLDTDMVVQAVHHLPLSTKSETAVEIHWNLTPPNQPYTVEVGEFWQRRIPAAIAGMNLYGLCPEDLLLHLCMHLAYMHEFACGLRPFCDIAVTLQYYGALLDWDAVIARAIRLRWGRGVYLALRLAHDWLGADVPTTALAALMPSDFDPALCAAAQAQVFTEVAETLADVPSTPFASLWERGRFGEKARTLRLRLFPARPLLARRYGVRPGTPAFYACYPRLWIDLAIRYGPVSRQLLSGDATMSQFVQSRKLLGQWMAEP